MARLPNFLVIIRSEKLSGKGQGRGAKKRTFRFGKKNVSFPKVETFRFADYISWYKAMNLYEKGYNIVFKVNEANEVTVESQPAWKHASYGEVFVSGKGALEDGVITVKLSHDVPNVGGFGEFKEILYLPAK